MKDWQNKLKALAARARALQSETTKRKSVSAAQQRSFDTLVADVEAYNAATKRFDISVERAVFVTPHVNEPAYSSRMIDTGQPGCTVSCPFFPPNRPEGYFCLPDGTSFCDPRTGITVCSYRCVRIPLSDLTADSAKPPRPKD
jgi:hypothetical protein